ncbi:MULTISPECIES: SusC/RagA family TonB-linked outer membrane protein [unclassified Flavobacterium]|uniref:SusC/RagA family TonB-linked outer membrane protein n=1 Tax=unclassified Flavobacterium TaxID=196869 RepID=UPI001F13DA2D|nr:MULTISPECIES: SusC/RagA family TonB-linked outer membrane protein [unclassified Flavobacterium]UMY66969.1 SusC/RagA family TonB-linked outer membrane protein [Flavobacterium sp. HJ-32-4]
MKSRLTNYVALLLLLFVQVAIAQQRTVTGTVTDGNGLPMPGVSVLIQGTQTGTQTDLDGKYSISAAPTDTLVFSFIGMQTQTQKATSTTLNVKLADSAVELEGVVVTSFGIKREKKALGYATTTVTAAQLTQVANGNPLETLSGKVAGADITSPGIPGASPKIFVRGIKSITGSTSPLIIVDGSPLNNSFTGFTGTTRSFDGGSGLNDIDPNNIETMTFLKGAAASALYGSRAGNGVIIITTKKGKRQEKIKIDFVSSIDMNEVGRLTHTQNSFGQGWNGLGYSALTTGSGPSNENGSWGPAFNGEIRPWGTVYNNSQQIKPYVALEDNVRDFYDTGITRTNALSISGGNDFSDFALSFTDLNSDGVIPTTADQYLRRTLAFNGGIKSGKFSTRIAINYVNKDQNAVNTGQGDDAGEGSTLPQDLMQIPRDISIVDLQDYKNNPFNSPSYYFTPYATNPWWAINENSTKIRGNNLYGNVNLEYKITPELTASWQIGGNYRNESIKSYGAIVDYLDGSPNDLAGANPVVGGVTEQRIERSEFDTYFNLNYNKSFTEKLRLVATLGTQYNKQEINAFAANVTGLDVPNYYELGNSANRPTISQNDELRKFAGVYLQGELSYNGKYFLTASVRRDITSTLPASDNVYYYPSVSLSGIFYEKGNDFVKLRAAMSGVANDTSAYQTLSTLNVGTAAAYFGSLVAPLGGVNFYELSSNLGNNRLKPEKTTEFEFGVESALFSNRLTLDLSVYYNKTKGLLSRLPVDPSTGYTTQTVNLGDLQNKGVELALGFTPLKTADFEWTVNYTFTKNLNEVTRIDGDAKVLINNAYGVNMYAEEGQPIGTFYVRTPVKNDAGQYVVNPDTGYYTVSEEENRVGNIQRDFVMGLQTTLRYKAFALAMAFDWKQGGEMYSYTRRLNDFVGNGIMTTYNDRNPFIIPNSVVDNGDGTYSENTTPISFENITNYWGNTTNNPGIEQGHIIDRTFVRMRDVSLYYTFPAKITDKLGITRLQLGIYGKNLFLWTPDGNSYVDPEVSTFGNGVTSEFGEFGSLPSQRAYGATLKLSF